MVCTALALEELAIVRHIIDAWEYFFKIPKPKLLLLKIQNDSKIILCHHTLSVALAQLAQKLAQVGIGRQIHQDVLILLALLPVKTQQPLL